VDRSGGWATPRLSSSAVNDSIKSRIRFVSRYVIAAATIPIGVVFGVGGLAQNWSRRLRGRDRRTSAEPSAERAGS
jgi:hypothetical protein